MKGDFEKELEAFFKEMALFFKVEFPLKVGEHQFCPVGVERGAFITKARKLISRKDGSLSIFTCDNDQYAVFKKNKEKGP